MNPINKVRKAWEILRTEGLDAIYSAIRHDLTPDGHAAAGSVAADILIGISYLAIPWTPKTGVGGYQNSRNALYKAIPVSGSTSSLTMSTILSAGSSDS